MLISCAGCDNNEHASVRVGKIVTIKVWHPWDGVQKEGLTKIIDEFNRTHKNIEIKLLFGGQRFG